MKPCCSRDDAAQAVALFTRLDFAGDADVVHRRHEHQKPAGERSVRRQPRALGAQRLLGDLDDDVLAFLDQLFDFRLRPAIASPPIPFAAAVCFVFALEPIELFDRIDDVRDVQKAVALEADVNERALHAGQHLRHPAFVDIADDAPLPLPLDEDLAEEIVLEDGHLRLVAIRGHNHFLRHSRNSVPGRRREWSTSRGSQ